MSKITINTSDAKSEINKINQKINSQLQSLTKQTTQLSSLLKESDGEFVKELRKQLKAEALDVSLPGRLRQPAPAAFAVQHRPFPRRANPLEPPCR